MKIEIGKKTQTIMVFLLFIGIASAVSDYGNNIKISGNIDAIYGNFTYIQGSIINSTMVNKSGDTMTGTLVVPWVNDTAGNAYLKNNTILNTSTVTVGRNTNGSVELTASASASASAYTIINVTQNYTIANASMTLFNVSAFTGTLNITLPVMTGSGKIFTITKTDASSNAVQINVTGNCCIDGVAWANITSQWTSLDLVDINSMWKIT